MTKFIFFGRLEYEKGIDLILDVFPSLYAKGITNWTLDVYGAGGYSNTVEALSELLPNNVFFHGRTDNKLIKEKLIDADYCLMPSRVIETFGLSALEALRSGVPVIGFKKGGIAPFVIDELDATKASGETHEEKLFSLVSTIIKNNKAKHEFPIGPEQLGLAAYSTDAWISQVKSLAGHAKRILMVSDFSIRIGGVEVFIDEATKLLEQHGFVVEKFGSAKKLSYAGLIKTFFNIATWRKLRKKIKDFKPDIVWCHSVIRNIGWLPLTAIPHDTKIRMMFHDMGYYVPYPSVLYNIWKVAGSMALSYWLQVGKTKNPLKIILLICKRFLLRVIKFLFRHHNTTYLVPSPFMQEPTEKWRAGKNQKVITLPHFVK